MSLRQHRNKKQYNPAQYCFLVGVLVSVISMFLMVAVPGAFAKSDSNSEERMQTSSVKKSHKKHSSRFLRVYVKGEGKILSSPQGLKCKGRTCLGKFPKGTQVVLTALPGSGKEFSGWRGACGRSTKCALRLNKHKKVRAVFSQPRLMRLSVKVKGDGKVRSYPEGLSCVKGICTGKFPKGTKVVLKAVPDSGHVFSGWRGACGRSTKCALRLNKHKKVRAVFSQPRLMRLSVKVKGDGKVRSYPEGLSCVKGICTGKFPKGTKVVLKAVPDSAHVFSGWRGACRGESQCRVILKRPKLVAAIFEPKGPSELMILEAKIIGKGSINSQPSGLSCTPEACIGKFPAGKSVILTAAPKEGHEFSGWDGACTGTGLCEVEMVSAKEVTATFTAVVFPPVALTVAVEGEGRVTSDPEGIDCPSGGCTHEFENGKEVRLLAVPKDGHMFDGWSGACRGKEPCSITMSNKMSITASFSLIPLPPVALSVTVVGDGRVTSTPVGINCPAGACMQNFEDGVTVILMASPNTGQVFSTWGGACSGSGTSCQVDMNLAQNVMATFVPGNPGMITDQEAKRFLEQSTWGPTPALIAQVKSIGKEAFINQQLALNTSTYPDPAATQESNSLTPARNQFFFNAFHQNDQLRQRMAFALSQIFVVSANTVGADFQMVPYLNLLRDNAFSNYEDLMRAVTLSPTMGRFLDMVNNDRTEPGSGLNPNENYPREFLQLFSVGTVLLNPDGSEQPGSIPPYDQNVILNLSRVMTGWTYPTKPGATARWRNPSFYEGPMISFDNHHDMDAKVLMDGFSLPANQSAVDDLNQAINHVFMHPNVGPFVATRLIRHFVTSNPSPQYIARITQVFNDNGNGTRGDLAAVIKAILLDTEASSVTPDGGHLREPVLFEISLLRALDATVDLANPLYSRARAMGQSLFAPPSVFNYFSPLYRIPGTSLYGPEFQIHSFSNAMNRANFVDRVVRNNLGTGATVDLTGLEALAANPGAISRPGCGDVATRNPISRRTATHRSGDFREQRSSYSSEECGVSRCHFISISSATLRWSG